ncbi:MAG: hypothetical protein IJ461_01285 [Clostridia bacterium]|nr:hypothetical protein [Clostridia bacterium]
MKNNEFQELVDRNLSGLVWDERRRFQVLCAVSKEEKPVKKISTTFVLIAAVLCISVTALAAGLVFSPRYEAARVANVAMKEQYGVTDDLLSLFHRQVVQHGDGTATVIYEALAGDFPSEQMGDYTVQVKGNAATVTWSNDGKNMVGGLAAEAYGPEQLRMLSYSYAESVQQLAELGVIAPKASAQATPKVVNQWTEADQAQADQALELADKANEQRLSDIAKAEAESKLSVQEASQIALDAICQEYALTDAQKGKLTFEPDSTYITYEGKQPQAHLLFWLWQGEGEQFTEKDGQYWVAIDLNTGAINDMIYDTGLAGNG